MIVMIARNCPPFARTRRLKSAICIARKFGEKLFAAGSKDSVSLNVLSDCKKTPSRHWDSRVEIRDLHCEEISETMVCGT